MAWEEDGNAINANEWLGTRNALPLMIRTNNNSQAIGGQPALDDQEAMRITPFQPGAAPQRGSVGIWTDAPRRALHVQGTEIHSGGAVAGFSFGNRQTPAFVEGPGNGERWVWYATEQTARLWSGTDKLTVLPNGNVGIGTVTPTNRPLQVQGSEIHTGGGGAGYSFGNRETAAFVDTPANGERWVWYATRGTARLWSGTDKLTVLPNGNVGIGTSTPTPGARLTVAGGDATWGNNSRLQTDQGGSIELGGDRNTRGTGTPYIDFHFQGLTQDFNTRIINISDNRLLIVAGTLEATGAALKPGGGSWGGVSDVRLKKNVKPLKGALGKLLRLRGMRFEWKEPEKQGNLVGPQMGLAAQEVEEVFPEWVDTDPSGYKILTVRGFEALAIEAFRELNTENETLKLKNEELEDRTKILESTKPERQPSGNRNGAVR